MSNEAVEKKTGRNWNGWIAVLDAAQVKELEHTKIARYLNQQHQLPGWWAQMITVGCERVRALRARNEKADGFAIGKSNTIAVALEQLYAAWYDTTGRQQWLPEPFTITTSTPRKDHAYQTGRQPHPRRCLRLLQKRR